jgi:hypothetical protein
MKKHSFIIHEKGNELNHQRLLRFFAVIFSFALLNWSYTGSAQQLSIYPDQPNVSFKNLISSTEAESCALSAFEKASAFDLNMDGWKDILLFYVCRPLQERGDIPEYPYLNEKLHNAVIVLLSDGSGGYRIATEDLFSVKHLEIGGETGGMFLSPLIFDINKDNKPDVIFSSNRDVQQNFREDLVNASAFQEIILSKEDGSYRLVQTTEKEYFALFPQAGPTDNGKEWYFSQYFKGQRTDLGDDPLPLVFEFSEATNTVEQANGSLSELQANLLSELALDFVGYTKYVTPDVSVTAQKNLIADELMYIETLELNRGATAELDRLAWGVSFQAINADGSLQILKNKKINDIFNPIDCPAYDRERFQEPGNDWFLANLELNNCWLDSATGLVIFSIPRFVAPYLWHPNAVEIRPFVKMEGYRLRRDFDVNSGAVLVPSDIRGLVALLEFDWYGDELQFKGFLGNDPFWSGNPGEILLMDANSDGFQDIILGGASYGPHDFHINDKQGALLLSRDYIDFPKLQVNQETERYAKFYDSYRFLFDLNSDGFLDVVQAPVGILDFQGYPPSVNEPGVLATVDGERWTLGTLTKLKWVSGNTEIYYGMAAPSYQNGSLTLPVTQVHPSNTYYRIELTLSNPQALEFQLSAVEEIGSSNPNASAVFDALSNTLNIPKVSVGSVLYQVELELVSSEPITFRLRSSAGL